MMDGMWLRRSVVAVVIVWGGAADPAFATEADDLIAQGLKLRQKDRDQDALALFQRALEQQPTPRAFAQVGTCEQALGLWASAEAHIGEALRHPQDAWIKKNEAALRSALALVQQHLGSVDVWGTPPGARISIDGEVVAKLPMSQPARAMVGRRALTVEAAGFLAETRTVEVPADSLIREHVALRSLAATAPSTTPAPSGLTVMPGTPGITAASSAAPLTAPPTAADSQPTIFGKWWFWAIVGTVAVAGGASIYLIATRNQSCQPSMGASCTNL
jgi:hypothetical protein